MEKLYISQHVQSLLTPGKFNLNGKWFGCYGDNIKKWEQNWPKCCEIRGN